jgi:hypothetical protein
MTVISSALAFLRFVRYQRATMSYMEGFRISDQGQIEYSPKLGIDTTSRSLFCHAMSEEAVL